MSKLIDIAVAGLNQLSYRKKFALIGAICVLPLALVFLLLIDRIDQTIDIARKELAGNMNLRVLMGALDQVQRFEIEAIARQNQPPTDSGSWHEAQVSRVLASRPAQEQFPGLATYWTDLQSAWFAIAKRASPLAPAELTRASTELRAKIQTLMLNAADLSTMVLDPDIDTYYLMDAIVYKLPIMVEHLHELRRWDVALRNGATVDGEDVVRIRTLANQIEAMHNSLYRNLTVVFNATPDVRDAIDGHLNSVFDASRSALQRLSEITQTTGTELSATAEHSEKLEVALRAHYTLYDAMSPAFDTLLEKRIAHNVRLKYVLVGVTIASEAVALFLFLAFYRAMMRTVVRLDQVAKQLSSDQPEELCALDESKDELGRMVGAFSTVAQRLRREWAQARLESERAINAETALRGSEERNRSIIANALDAVIGMDASGRVTEWNRMAEQLFGWSYDEAIGQPLAEMIVPHGYRERHAEGLRRYVQSGKGNVINRRIEITALRRDGSEFPIELIITPVGKKEEVGFTAFIEDISVRQKTRQALVDAKEAAEAASRAKSEFLANMSHEIRTPMNGMLGMAELLLHTELSEQQRHFVQTLHASGAGLMHIIDEILDFSRIESGKLELERVVLDIRHLFAELADLMAVKAHGKGLEYVYEIAHDVPNRILGDPTRLRQVLLNLIGNAIKFTDQGEVTAHVSLLRGDNQGARLRFEIRDTGIGISQDAQREIFNAFSQADTSTTRRYGGTGLGLAISQRLIALMGGTLGVASVPGTGSTFWIETALSDAAELTNDSATPDLRLNGRRVLLADDNASCRGALRRLVSANGMVPIEARSGEIAIELAREGMAKAKPFDVIVLDLSMPRNDGLTVAAQLRDDVELSSIPRILLVPAGTLVDDAALRAGNLSATLTKPVRPERFLQCLRAAIVKSQDETVGEPLADELALGNRPRRHGKVLVVEDNPVNQEITAALLESLGYACQIAANGREAINVLSGEHFDLVLMDCQMPVMSGFEATAAIRAAEKELGPHSRHLHGSDAQRRMPVIALTANALVGDRERCIAAGMDDYLSKPFTQQQLAYALDRWLVVTLPQDDPSISADEARAVIPRAA